MPFWKRPPAKTELPQPAKRSSVAAPIVQASERKSADKNKQEQPNQDAPPKHGFDPYNSGAFDRRDTWGKVIRK